MNLSSALSSERREKLYVAFLASLTAIPPLATDMYLAAIPTIAREWKVSESLISLSLVLWFATFSVGLLFCGPLSDRFGRKPVLLVGMTLFSLASFLCALGTRAEHLILFRVLQGLGASAPSAMGMAICRDRYEGDRRKLILAYMAILLSIVPVLSPILGALLLQFTGWRVIFITQGVLVLLCLGGAFFYRETLAQPILPGMRSMFGPYLRILKNTRYLLAVFSMQVLGGPFFGYIAVSSLVYISFFGLSPNQFSLFFGVNAFISMLGAFTCTRLHGKIRDLSLLTLCIAGASVGGAGLLLGGHWHPLGFAVGVGIYTFCYGMSRPLSNHIILEQVERDIGSASSVLVFVQYMVGACCMWIVTLPWETPPRAFGFLAFAFPAAALLLWPLLLRKIRVPR